MFIFNLKLDYKIIFKILFILLFIVILIIAVLAFYKIFNYSNKIGNEFSNSNIAYIDSNNYTNILKCVHDNLDDYVGQKISFSGYIYRVYDFNENQFVLARNMIINNNQSVVVGFLCECKTASEFPENSWVTITGEITKGDYHGEIPVIKILEINSCEKPNEEFVYPPDDTYIPTSVIF